MMLRLPLFSALGAALFLASCAKHETAVDAGLRTQTLHLGNSAEPPDLDPHTNNASAVDLICTALFEGLVRLESDGVSIRPGVAERWEISPDGLTYTFHLRADAKWSNGDAVTADDFFAAFRRFLEPKLGCEGVSLINALAGARDYVEGRNKDFASVGVKAPDPRTLVLQLQYRAPYFLTVVSDSHLSPLHQPSLDRFNGRDQRGGKWTQPGNLVSNGPFVLKEWLPNQVVAVAKNPRYWDAGRVKLNEIRFYPIEDGASEERAYRTGQLHVTYSLPFNKLAAYSQRQAPELRLSPTLRADYVTFSTQRPPFNDARVRRAFALAIDREQLAATILKGRGTPAYSFVPAGAGGYTLPPFSRYDPVEAKKLLREAGFPDGAGFPTVEYTLNSRNEDVLTLAQALQQMWQQTLGVKVTLAPTEFKVWLDLLRTKSFAMTADTWSMGFNDPAEMLPLAVTGDPNNDAGWSNARYDAAFPFVNTAPNDAARREAIIACEKIIAEEAPYAPVFKELRAQLMHPSVRGWIGTPLQRVDWTAISLEAPK
jgi:oligopeptide transport system substrate-binding protein